MARTYTKRNPDYWQNRHNRGAAAEATPPPPTVQHFPGKAFPDIIYGATQISRAAGPGGAETVYRGAALNNPLNDQGGFQNIKALPATWVGYSDDRSGGYTGCVEAITLCAKAWAGIAVIRNAIEVAVEFSSQALYVKSSNETVQTFFTEWLKAIQINRLKEQFFREYYRSGNVFLYRFDGKFGPAYYRDFQSAFGARENKVPIRYELLNPSNVFVPAGVSFPYTYVRLLSTYECERLRNPMTEQDRQVFKDLPKDAQEQIMAGGATTAGIYLQMDPNRLRYAFYKKQDYEPMGIPFAWPILPSVEWKLALTKMDKQLARTIDHAILLVTNGEPPSKENGGNGINQNNIIRLQALLNNPTTNRVLVADYTTKASWLVPPIQEILGPAKYQVVNEDIREGLQSILAGDDKFANAQIKAKIFIQRLEQGQERFLSDFLMPEVLQICDIMGFRSVPEIGFKPIDLQDEAIMARIYAQLAQIGVLTAPQAVKAIETQILPNEDELISGHEAFKKLKDKKLFKPLIGGEKEEAAGPNGRPGGSSGTKQSTKKVSPIGTSRAAYGISLKGYADCLRETNVLGDLVASALRKKYKVKGSLNEVQQRVADILVKKIVAIHPREKWVESVAATIEQPPVVPAAIANELDDISTEFGVDDFDAALIRHCRTEAPTEDV